MKPLQKKIIQRKISDAREQRRAERIRKTENPTEDRRAWRSTEKARRGLARVIFSRGFLIALLVLFQILKIQHTGLPCLHDPKCAFDPDPRYL